MGKIGIIGGGAAGMMAAIFARKNGHEVHLFEKNEKLGKKLFITGKGRCNLTNACEIEELFQGVLTNYRFLYSAFYSFSNEQTMEFFEELGVPLKIERGNRVFPVSDHSWDIIDALKKRLKQSGVKIHLNTEVKGIVLDNSFAKGITLSCGKTIELDACIVATGGLSYPSTGSTGDGYKFAKEAGHNVTHLLPGLISIETKEDIVKELQGLSLRNVSVKIFHEAINVENRVCPSASEGISCADEKKVLHEEFGEMLFTHYGVSGPIILSASSIIGKELALKNLSLTIDLKPALSFEQLDQRVLREFSENSNRQFKNGIGKLFPAKLLPVMIRLSGINPEKPINSITKEERIHFVNLIKNFPLTLTALRPLKEAIITKGGIDVKEIDPSTMESKLVKNLYFAGEVLDLDGVTGGFNLQIAWSTGYLAGTSS